MQSIGVLIPTYNRAHLLRRALDSVTAQTRPVDQILVVDDGSTDDTAQLVASYRASPVRYLRQNNAGVSAARNRGIAALTSDWIAFLDSDDYWMPRKIERQMEELARSPGAVLAYTGRIEQWSDGRSSSLPATDGTAVWPQLRVRNMVPASAAIVRRDVLVDLGGFDESLLGTEDWDMWFRVYTRGSFIAAPEPLTVITESCNSVSANVDRMVECTRRIADKSLLTGLTGWQREVWRRRIVSAELYRSFITLRDRHGPGATRYLWESLQTWPSPAFLPKRFASMALTLRNRPAAA